MFRLRFTGLWRNPDFVKLWSGQTISVFGTLMGALQFTAVVVLDATPFEMGVLGAAGVAPGLAFGLFAGVWVDRLRRRPIMIITDVVRGVMMGSIPIVFLLGFLRIEQLYLVAFVNGGLTIFFDVAHRSYLPSLVRRNELVEANSKLTASTSVVEASAFSIGGWIVQLISAIAATIIDAITFFISALFIASIRKLEPVPTSPQKRQNAFSELGEGLKEVWQNSVLRSIGFSTASFGLSTGIIGAVILIFGIRELGIPAGILGTIFAVGGVSAFGGSVLAGRITRRFGLGPALILGLFVYGLSTFLIPLAQGPIIIASAFLVAQQIAGDGGFAVYDISQTSLRQGVTPERLLGRVNASIQFIELGFTMIGSLLAGVLTGAFGLRWTIAIGAFLILSGAIWMAASPTRSIRVLPATSSDP